MIVVKIFAVDYRHKGGPIWSSCLQMKGEDVTIIGQSPHDGGKVQSGWDGSTTPEEIAVLEAWHSKNNRTILGAFCGDYPVPWANN